jgi:hypothetical protein
MAKKKEQTTKLYHGTIENLAKLSCVKGLTPYDIDVCENGFPRSVCASTANGISLTSTYPGLMAFDTAAYREKWGIIEVDVSQLHSEIFLPYEGFLLEKAKTKVTSEEDRLKKLLQFRSHLSSHRRKWRDSLDEYGFCVYEAAIPVQAISRVMIYDPASNWSMTKAIVNTMLGIKMHASNLHHQQMITRWLMGDNVTAQEWIGSAVYSKMTHAQKDKLSQMLQNKNGLDIFYAGPTNGKK